VATSCDQFTDLPEIDRDRDRTLLTPGGYMKVRSSCAFEKLLVVLTVLIACFGTTSDAQQATSVVPTLVNFSGTLTDANGKPLTGTVGVTFYLYKDDQGGSPLWMETQNVQPDKTGHYTVALGSSKNEGLPTSLFASGEARWLAVQAQGQAEQPRVLLLSVPYALKALDAESIGGRPASAFMLAPVAAEGGASAGSPASTITGSGTADYVPMFTGTTTIGDSNIYQNASGNIGIGTTSPAATLDVKGKSDVRDTLTLFPKSTHAALTMNGTAFQVASTGKVTFVSGQTFPGTGTVTSVGSGAGLTGGPITTSGSLSIATGGVTNGMLQHSSLTVAASSPLTGGGSVSLGGSTSLGLKACSSNQILEFTSGAWSCVAIPAGTISGVTAGTDLTGGGSSGNVTLNLDTTKVPQLAAFNTFTNYNAISMNSSSEPGLTILNSASGYAVGIDVVDNGSTGEAVEVTSNTTGIDVASSGTGGVFDASDDGLYSHGGASGIYAESDTDADYFAGSYGYEGGSTAITVGVFGFTASPNGAGVSGRAASYSNLQSGNAPTAGVWGDTGQTGNIGVLGTADDGYGAEFANNSPSGYDTLRVVGYDGTDSSARLLNVFSNAFGGGCIIDVNGNLSCTGNVTTPVKVKDGSRQVALNAIASPESWFEDFGSGQLSGGTAVISLEPTYVQTVNTGVEYHVFLTPKGDSHGLYVTNETSTSFEVREQGGGTSNIAFDYRIVAKRIGFENIRLEDKTRTMAFSEPKNQRRYSGGPHHPPSNQELRGKHSPPARRIAGLTSRPVKKID
jgi:hypothetical protein